MLITVNELPDNLREHVPDMYGCVRNALTDFVAEHRDRRGDYTPRTEASIIHDYMVKHAKACFPSSWTLKQNLFLLRLGQDYLVKLKRLDQHHHVSRIATNLSLRFEGQEQLSLFDDLDRIHLHLGYQVDPLAISESRIWIVRPEGPLVRFAAELTADLQQHAVQFPTSREGNARRVTPKIGIVERAVGNDA